MFYVIDQAFRRQHTHMRAVLQSLVAYSLEIDAHAGGHFIFLVIMKGNACPKPIDHIVDQVHFHTESHRVALAWKHII